VHILSVFWQSISLVDIVDLSSRLRHRGPDWSGAVIHGSNIYAHERLSIVGLLSGEQPMLSTDQEIIITVNGEIYNYKELMATALKGTYEYQTGSDCEVLLYLVRPCSFLSFTRIMLYS
jgi:asparagine synthase (glutamine-hydrolysing)